MLTNEQMNQLDMEVKQRGMGINPDVMPTQDEADNYAFTPEATVPETPMPEAYTPEPDNMAAKAAKELINFTDSVIADVKKTNIWKRYTYGKEEVLREARDISIETGIPESAILYSPQTLDNARGVYNYRRKQMELMPPGSDEVSIDLLTKAYPGLEKIINNNSEVDAAIALQNIKNVRQVNGIVDAARTGWQGGMLQHEIAKIGKKAFMEGRAVTDAEFAKYEKIQKQIEDLRQTPSFVEDPFLSIVGGTAQQVPQQLRGLGTGALYGTALAATAAGATVAVAPLTGGASMAAVGTAARTGWKWGMRLGYAVDMWQDSAGQRYIEYSRFKDKDGKRVLTDEEARAYAAAAAAVETGIEFMNAGKIMDVLKGNKSAAARQIQEAVAGATDNATFTAALKRVLSGVGEIAVTESLEEGGQEAADRIMSNFVASYKGGNIPKYTPGQVLQGAVESFAEALPASIGFGLSAAGGGSIGLVRRAAAYSELQDLHVRERLKNVTGINMIQNMIQDNGIKDFFKKDTDIAKDFLHNTVEGTGYEKVNIDTQLVLEQEGGMNALQDIAQAAGMSADEIQNAVETGADITVPTEVYFQMRAENENFAIGENFISFSDTAPCFARNQYYAKMVKSELDAVMRDVDARQMEQQQAALDMIVQGNFAEGLEQDAAAAILTIRPDNPAEGWKEMRGMYKQQLDDILAPVIKELKSGMKQGVDIVRVEGERAHYERISNNAQWARKFYAENKRWPTQFELEGMAIDILSGRDFTKLPDFQNRPEMEPIYEDNAAKIDELLNTIEVFDGIRDKIAAIDADELQTMEGMSREAYDVYRNVAQQLAASAPNDAVKRSAKAGAALLARRADRYAEAMRAAGNTNYTAADYFRDRFGLRVGGTFQGGGSNTLFQVPAAEFNRQKAEVRTQYEGKDGWMKAPNGSDTNLTEDQWITVRTPAFKNWFGDWENDPENASKVLDENGEPLVVKHWTMEDVKFDTFSREFLGDNTIDNASEPAVGATSLLGFWFNSGGDENLSSVYDRDMNLFLSIENPKEYASLAELAYFINIEDGADLTMEDYQRAAAELKEALQNEGYDGIVINDEEFGGKSFVAFESNQIKDASGRNVGFDPASGNIYFQRKQRQGDVIQGATEFQDDGRRIVSIFESGNESTMAHELGHIFVADLKELAEMPNAPEQIVKDWETVKKWIGWKNGQENFTTPQQEKFARGFEAYLRTGEAPATGLRKIFRQFKNWLTKIYKDFLSLGGKPSADVQAVMARMLATEQEVENAFKLREAENFEKVGGFDYLAKDSAEMYKRWQEEAQEYAKEKVLAQAMKDLTKQRSDELAALRDQMKTDIRQQLQEKPLYRAQALLEQNPKLPEIWPAEALGMTYEEYTQAIAEQGPLDKAVKTAVDAAMQEVEQGLPMEKIKQAAEAAVNSSEYRGLYLTFEQDFMEKKQRRDETLNKKIEKILDELEKAAYESNIETIDPQGKIRASEPETDTPAKRKIRELKYQARWSEAEMKAINRMELAASMDELQAAVRDFKAIFKKTRQDVRVYRDTAVQKYKLIKQYAADNMAEMPISEATNVAKWAAMEKRAGRESIEAMKRAIDAELKYQPEEKGLVPTEPASEERLPAERKAKESPADLWRQANEAKLRQRVFAEYAAMAQKNKNYIRKKNARLQARSKTIAKNNNMPANERYMYNHGLYVLGLSKQDAPVPQDAMSLMEMIQGYKDNLQAFFVDEDGNISMPDYAVSAMTGNTAYNGGYQNLTMEQYQYFNDMLTAIYKAGIDANKVKSMKDINGNTVLISDVATAIVDETNARVPLIMTGDVTNVGTPTFAQSIQNKARRARVELTKPETILDMMGPTAYRYVYETVNQSWNKEQGMLEESAKVMQAIWAPYSNTEKSEMRAKKQYRFGTSILTKEQMICVAFNWGTEINRKRIMDGFGVDEMTVNELLSNLTQKDWQMVSAVWELVNSYWPETARVEESMTGIAPQKQTAMPFEITGKDGQVYKLQGGYYPIKYDPSKSLKAANQQQDDMAKQYAANNATMNRNRGFTKQRVQGTVARPVLLSFDVLNKHISDVVHNICFRESLRDVNRIIKSPEVSQTLQDHFGIDQTRALEQWVRDCWAPDVAKKDVFATGMEFFRHKQTAAALGYRMTTAMLNALNIYLMTDYLGAARTMDALGKFYSDPKANWDFCLSRSIFLRQRAQTMDRDAGEVLRKEFIGGYGTVADTLIRGERALEKHAFDALAVTDLMLANPLWMAEYQRVYQERTAELKGKMDAAAWSRIEMEAVAAGDKAVRKVFGSGEMKDLSPVQKGGEMTKAVTMFYSYFNVVFNALYSGYGEGRMQAMGTDSKIMLAPLAKKMLYWLVLTGVTEGLMRTAIDALVGDGGDDPEEWMKAMVKGVSDNIAGTIPVFRDIWSGVIDKLMGERYYGARPLPLYTVYDNIMKLSNTISSNKKSKIDVFREGARITNGMTGIGNAVTDAFATTAYWADTDFDAPLYQYLAAVFFDKRLDKKKK